MSKRLKSVSRKALKKYQSDAARIADIIIKRAKDHKGAKQDTTDQALDTPANSGTDEPKTQSAVTNMEQDVGITALAKEFVDLMESLHIHEELEDLENTTTDSDPEINHDGTTHDAGHSTEVDEDPWCPHTPRLAQEEDRLKKRVDAGVFDYDEMTAAGSGNAKFVVDQEQPGGTTVSVGDASSSALEQDKSVQDEVSTGEYVHIPSVPGITEDERKRMEGQLQAINRLLKNLETKDEELKRLRKEKDRIRLSTIAKECDSYILNGSWRPGHRFSHSPRGGLGEGHKTNLKNAYTSDDLVWFDQLKEVARLTELGYRALYDLKGRRWSKLENHNPSNFRTVANPFKYQNRKIDNIECSL